MNVFVKEFALSEAGIELIERLDQEFSFKRIYFVGGGNAPETWANGGAKLEKVLDYDDAQFGFFDGVDWNEIEPLESELIERMAYAERQALSMLDREKPTYHKNLLLQVRNKNDLYYDSEIPKFNVNRHYAESRSYHERRDFYLRFLRYWNHFLNCNAIDYFFFASVPHGTSEYILYELLRVRKKPVIMLERAPFKDRAFVIKDFRDYSFLRSEIIRDKASDLKQDECIKSEIKRLTQDAGHQEIPHYEKRNNLRTQKERRLLTRIVKVLGRLKLGNIARLFRPDVDFYHYLIKGLAADQIFERKLAKFYERNSSEPDYFKKYIYFPLHYQPELTTAPLGGVFSNQLLVAQMLAYHVPEDVLIYVKEHPQQRFRGRTISMYLDLLKIKNVRLIKKSVSSFELLEECVATASVTGTAGWEGLFKGKPFLMFGDYIYKEAPGVFRIRNNDDCRDAICQVFNEGIEIQKEDLLRFVDSILVNSVYGFTQKPGPELDCQRAVEEMSREMIKQVSDYRKQP